MIDKTLESVINQINAMGADNYQIGVYNRQIEQMIIFRKKNLDDIIKSTPWLKYKNLLGSDIYIKPDPDEERALVLIDDINKENLISMNNRGVNPACVVETSPKNYQTWVSLGNEPLAGNYIKCIASLLAKEFNGDPACAASSHFGRLAGFTNRKKEHQLNNIYPYVICHEYSGNHAIKHVKIREWAIKEKEKKPKISLGKIFPKNDNKLKKEPSTAFLIYFESWLVNTKRYHNEVDLSRGDFAVACRMIKEGYLREDIIISMSNNSPNIKTRKGKHLLDYVTRTVDSAIKCCCM
ncbi:MAG: RepB family DNA primase [Elusimicrobiota bacterium]|jgi:hypothetical protein|nr:RepB family DNA primase [Elusimicrobiota bacterium]